MTIQAHSRLAEQASEWLKERTENESRWEREREVCTCGPKHVPDRKYGKRWACRRCGKIKG